MFDIGGVELLLVVLVAVLVFKPTELPNVLRSVGKTLGWVRGLVTDVQKKIDDVINQEEVSISEASKSKKNTSKGNYEFETDDDITKIND